MDAADEVWDQVANALESFLDAWDQQEQPPSPAAFAPSEPVETRRLALVELIKIDLEYRAQRHQCVPRLEEYADLDDSLQNERLPADLIYEEYNLRRRGGEEIEPTEYFERFPSQSDQLRNLLGLGSPDVSTSLAMAARPKGMQAGDTIDDFDLLAELGAGAFASVFLARQRSLQRIVALKVSRNQGQEPQTLAQLDHPHIGRVYDQRVLPERDLRLLYMKYVPGGTLEGAVKRSREEETRSGKTILAAVDDALDRRGEEPPLESSARAALAEHDWPTAVCRIGAQLAQALDYAHRLGVLHRDLKPANILLTAEGSPQLVDFNISFCSKLDGATPAAYFGGSLAYMSPEQLEAANPAHPREADSLDGRSDIYSLAVVLWELLAGERPFRDEQLTGDWPTTLAAMALRRQEGPNPETLASAGVSAPIEDILMRCLSADPNTRPQTGEQLATELRLCLQPEALQLLRPPANGYIMRSRRWSLSILLVLAMLPNILAGIFNYVYNRDHIVATLKESQDPFWNVQAAINSVAYPLGVILLGASYFSVTRAARGREGLSAERLDTLRRRCLNLGQTSAFISAAEWLVAGFAYPLGMNAAGVQLGPADYVHFLISLALCGIIAATYPFFGVTAYAVHFLYPALVTPEAAPAVELERLSRLERKAWFYLALGFVLPMLAVVLVVTFGAGPIRVALSILSAGTTIGCCGLFWAARRIQRDIATLRAAILPE